jgi:hypothetical protein
VAAESIQCQLSKHGLYLRLERGRTGHTEAGVRNRAKDRNRGRAAEGRRFSIRKPRACSPIGTSMCSTHRPLCGRPGKGGTGQRGPDPLRHQGHRLEPGDVKTVRCERDIEIRAKHVVMATQYPLYDGRTYFIRGCTRSGRTDWR